MLERSRFWARLCAACTALACAFPLGCSTESWPRPAPMSVAQFGTEFRDWREYRRSRLVVPGSGPVTWVGLWELHDGETAVGADSTLAIVLPASDCPRLLGTLQRTGNTVHFKPALGTDVRLADSNRTAVAVTLELESDRTDSATVLAVGSLRMRVHGEPGTERLWLRVWDEEHPARDGFTLPASYAPDTTWRIAARFQPFEHARELRVTDILGGTQAFRATGELVFRITEREQRLTAFADSTSKAFFVMFWDSTATTTTYEGGRYLRVEFPDSTGWTVIDFNRGYNPPCVFTPYSTCALPPRENRLPFSVTAGEKRAR